MPKTFNAWLSGNYLEWIDDVPELGAQRLQVHITVLNEKPVLEAESRGQRMAEILENLAATNVLSDVDPYVWQQEIRRDRTLPGR